MIPGMTIPSETLGQCFKTFLSVIYKKILLTENVCQIRLEKFARGKRSSLSQKFLSYKLTPGPNVIKLFTSVIYKI
jgi:hypothetical protein